MGIPSYFNFILKNHPNIILNKKYIKSDYLFIDSNSLIYDCINELQFKIENRTILFEAIYKKIQTLIDLINPIEKSYICFDGVPPLPKMYQQRQRRFKSIMTKQILNKNKSNLFNTNQITPGTDFMNDLDNYLNHKYENETKVIFDGSCNKGEGEHKICDYIRSNHDLFYNKSKIIYGLDADLIMLGLLMSCETNNIYLYKETKYFNYISGIKDENYYYFNIGKLGLQIDNVLKNGNIKQSIYDYIFLCFLCGNDFLPHLSCINIRNDGINFILNNYKLLNVNKTKCIIDKDTKQINWIHFREYIQLLEKDEMEKIEENINWKMKFQHKIKPLNDEDKLNSLPCFDLDKEKYLLKHINEYNEYILKGHNVKDLCLKFLRTLEWTWYYYNGNLLNNYVYYDESHGPLLKDILNYIPVTNNESVNLKYDIHEDINPITQLYFVLPYCDHSIIIPKNEYDKSNEIIYNELPLLKNDNYDIDYCMCKYFWEGRLLLENIDIYILNNLVKINI